MASRVEANRGQFRKGRSRTGGRRKGAPNKASRAWKEFVQSLADDPKMQDAARRAISTGKIKLLFKAAEHAYGKPRQALEVNQGEVWWIQWPDNQDIAEE